MIAELSELIVDFADKLCVGIEARFKPHYERGSSIIHASRVCDFIGEALMLCVAIAGGLCYVGFSVIVCGIGAAALVVNELREWLNDQ